MKSSKSKFMLWKTSLKTLLKTLLRFSCKVFKNMNILVTIYGHTAWNISEYWFSLKRPYKAKYVSEKTSIVAYSMQWQIFMNMRNQYCFQQSKYMVFFGQHHLVLGLNITSGTLQLHCPYIAVFQIMAYNDLIKL